MHARRSDRPPRSPSPRQVDTLARLAATFSQLQNEGLLVSVGPTSHAAEERAAAALGWMAARAAQHGAFAEPIVDALLGPLPSGPGQGTLPPTPGLLEAAPLVERRAVLRAHEELRNMSKAPPPQPLSSAPLPVQDAATHSVAPSVANLAPDSWANLQNSSAAPSSATARDAVSSEGPSLVGEERVQIFRAASSEWGSSLLAAPLGGLATLPPRTLSSLAGSPALGRMLMEAAGRGRYEGAAIATAGKADDPPPPPPELIDSAAGRATLAAADAAEDAAASGVRPVLLPPSTPAERAAELEEREAPPASAVFCTLATEGAAGSGAVTELRTRAPPLPRKLRLALPSAHRAAGTRFEWRLPCACKAHTLRFSTRREGSATAVVPWDASECELALPGMSGAPSGWENEVRDGSIPEHAPPLGEESSSGGGETPQTQAAHAGGAEVAAAAASSARVPSAAAAATPVFPCPTVLWWLLEADALLPRTLTAALHRVYLACLGVPGFRLVFARTYSRLYLPLALRYASGVGTKAECLFGFSTQVFTAPSLLHAAGASSTLGAILLSLDRTIHQSSDLEALEIALSTNGMPTHDAHSAASERERAAVLAVPLFGRTADAMLPSLVDGRPQDWRRFESRTTAADHAGRAGSPAEWTPRTRQPDAVGARRPDPTGTGRVNRIGATAPMLLAAALQHGTGLPSLLCDEELLVRRRYDVMVRDLDYVLHSIAVTADAPLLAAKPSAAGGASAASALGSVALDALAAARPMAAPHGTPLLRRWLQVLERVQGADPQVRLSLGSSTKGTLGTRRHRDSTQRDEGRSRARAPQTRSPSLLPPPPPTPPPPPSPPPPPPPCPARRLG